MRATSAIPSCRVIAWGSLAEVVEQRSEQEEIGPIDTAGEGGGVGGRLPQVAVDGEAVVGVALRTAAHRRPLRQQAHEDAVLIERLEHVDRPVPLAEQGDQLVDRPIGPALLPRVDVDSGGQPVERRAGEADLPLRGHACRTQHEYLVIDWIGPAGQLDLPVDDDEAVADALLVADLVP